MIYFSKLPINLSCWGFEGFFPTYQQLQLVVTFHKGSIVLIRQNDKIRQNETKLHRTTDNKLQLVFQGSHVPVVSLATTKHCLHSGNRRRNLQQSKTKCAIQSVVQIQKNNLLFLCSLQALKAAIYARMNHSPNVLERVYQLCIFQHSVCMNPIRNQVKKGTACLSL